MRLTTRQAFFIILVIGLFLMTMRPIADPDYWWHLKTGQFILDTHAIPHTDPFSYTKAGYPWITHEWLTEILMYSIYKYLGAGILILIFSAIITSGFLLAYFRAEKESRPYVAGFALFLGAISTAPTWGVRPQMISLLLTSLFLFLLDRYTQELKIKYLIPIPIIMAVWVNLHAGFFLGLAIIAIYIIGGLIEILLTEFSIRDKEKIVPPSFRTIITLCVVLGISAAATLLNPNGFHIILYPFTTLTSQSMQQLIQEWLSPDFHQLEWQPFAWLILALIAAGMLGRKAISAPKILLTIVLGYAALRSMRNIPLFAVAVIPILAEQVSSIIKIVKTQKVPGNLIQIGFYIVIAGFCFLTGYRYFQVIPEQTKIQAQRFPENAVTWLENNHPEGRIFNTYGWGGYLIWKLYPEYPVYIDGRADVYGDAFLFEYNSIYHSDPGWEGKLASYNVQIVIIEPGSPLANSLRESSSWENSFEDSVSVVFTRN